MICGHISNSCDEPVHASLLRHKRRRSAIVVRWKCPPPPRTAAPQPPGGPVSRFPRPGGPPPPQPPGVPHLRPRERPPPPQKRRAASHEWTGYPVFPSRMPPRSAVVVGAVGGILGARRLLSVLARRGVLPRIDVQVAIDVDAVTRCSVDGAIVLCSVVSVSPQGEPLPRVLELSQPCKATDSTHRL